MSELSVQDWKVFLKARITQEQGKDDQALRTFEELLQKYPGNVHLSASRTFALQRLGRTDEAAASTIAAKYATLGRTLIAENDKPEVWTSELHAVLSQTDEYEKSGRLAATLVAW